MAVDVELETMLRAPEVEQAKYPAKMIMLANGSKMIVREARREEVPILLDAIRPTLKIEKDFYDIVGARLYAELLGWYRFRVRNEYCLVGQIDGYLVGIVNGRMMNRDTGISYHTLAIDRGLRVGLHLFAAKMEHHLEYLGQQEVRIAAESPNGLRRTLLDYGLEKLEEVQHELGGATTYLLSREIYFEAKTRLVVGDRPVPDDLLDKALERILIPDEKMINEKIAGMKGR